MCQFARLPAPISSRKTGRAEVSGSSAWHGWYDVVDFGLDDGGVKDGVDDYELSPGLSLHLGQFFFTIRYDSTIRRILILCMDRLSSLNLFMCSIAAEYSSKCIHPS